MTKEQITITVSGQKLPALLDLPHNADWLFVFGHGSEFTIDIPLMESVSEALNVLDIATLRFEYPYSAHPDYIPFTGMPTDSDEMLIATILGAVKYASEHYPNLKRIVGGHSISGLITTFADAKQPINAGGIICLGYPRKGDEGRSRHLTHTSAPILFIQGTQDKLGSVEEIQEMMKPISNRSSLSLIDMASHRFTVDGRQLNDVTAQIAGCIRNFVDEFSDR